MAHSRHTIAPAGPSHPAVREYLDIKRNRGDSAQAVVVEGLWGLRHALDAEVQIDAVFVCPDLVRGADTDGALERAAASGAQLLQVSERLLRRLVDRDGPDGLTAVARLPTWRLTSLRPGPTARLVVIDGLELPGNIGTILRAADGAGATAVAVTNRRARLTHPTLLRASMGTLFTTPLIDVDDGDLERWLREHRFRVIAAHPASTDSYRGIDYRGRVALVLGSERDGLRQRWLHAADELVTIPMLGVADSLNVGHAAALLLYEALHQSQHSEHTSSA